ncbi:hypothetical protein C8J57DRAFT_1357721 [Mycena rebaudengoi]|nr:hypothetical protein C8J57DRAFT_1357721 [Mycena rebaudengoi]
MPMIAAIAEPMIDPVFVCWAPISSLSVVVTVVAIGKMVFAVALVGKTAPTLAVVDGGTESSLVECVGCTLADGPETEPRIVVFMCWEALLFAITVRATELTCVVAVVGGTKLSLVELIIFRAAEETELSAAVVEKALVVAIDVSSMRLLSVVVDGRTTRSLVELAAAGKTELSAVVVGKVSSRRGWYPGHIGGG